MIPAVLIVITLHELSHGFAAYLLGDTTARDRGRLTFNPIAHIDIFGFLCMLVAGIGWAKPVPVSPYRFRMKNKKLGMAITALAGPLSNLLIAFVFLFIRTLLVIYGYDVPILLGMASFMEITAVLSIGLMAFNLIPIPPLDGSKVLLPFLPNKVIEFFYKYERYISIGFLIVLMLDLLDGIINSVVGWFINIIMDVIINIIVGVGLI
ncbi:MAG: site-2 protease family protein [Clostridia bacterium]|nr:site-2 protease family protein [Clostridia bacterium]